ncbi:chromosome segregation protein SMC [Alloscardovia theropitheci]|uniref:Chromosome partition protein Smc n=1 Tax=Alloscardovia theropitheci TaxID=2496842 RepID=A0A4R0QWQ6_9BIFI|nr:AAA family ATPase [Alloscardovia theropitheci]TCD53940.1 chromosome segregation protein SMC [Alloscardovia theropitheci]
MYVKELTIRGFKSFANATTLRFEPGVTAIVGPNGSGKSNVVDALAWVMGEQGAKSLRGTSMEDVIFAGTSTRAPLGRAQVSLTIDNTDGTLNIDYSEVTISRTIFRNGGSEYAINGSPVRLLDVQELLSDTGLGAHMHVVVGQGRLDSILRATPADNRAFIEEAAGILKHRKRKERALRKLQSTVENVERLDDLLGEIQRQLGPLRRQARISRRADNIQVIIRDATSRLLADDAKKLMIQRDDIRRDLVSTREQLQKAQRELTSTKLEIERLESLAGQSSPAIDAVNQTYHRMAQIQERLKALSALALERENSWRSQIVTMTGDNPDLLNARADELEGQQQEAHNNADEARLAFDKATQDRARIEQDLAAHRQMMTQLRKSAQEQESHKAKLRETIARQEAQIQGLETRIHDLEQQKLSYDKSRTDAQNRLDTLQQDSGQSIENLDEQREKAQSDLASIRSQREEAEAQIREIDNTIISLRAKADALSDTLEARSSSGDLERSPVTTLGNLADYIHIEEGWEEAIAKALGQFASAVVVPDSESRNLAMDIAHDERMGRAIVIYPTDMARMTVEDLTDTDSTVLNAASVISVNPAIDSDRRNTAEGIVRSLQTLLCDVALVHKRSEAARVINDSRICTVMTQDGDTFTAVGAIGGISKNPSDLSLTARRDKALSQVKELSLQVETLKNDKAAIDARYDDARTALGAIQTAITENRVLIQQRDNDIKAAQSSVESLLRRIDDIDEQISSLQAQSRTQTATLEDLHHQLEIAEQAQNAQVDMESLVNREQSLDKELAHAREEEVSARLTWNNTSQRAQSLERQVTLLRSQAKQAAEHRARVAVQNEERTRKAQKAHSVAKRAERYAQEMDTHIGRVLHHRDELQAEASLHNEELTKLRSLRKEQEPIVSSLTQSEHELDVARERIATQYGQISQRIVDELGSSIETVIERFGPDNPVPVFDDDGQLIPLNDSEQSSHGEIYADRANSDSDLDSNSDSDSANNSTSDNSADLSMFKTEVYNRDREQKKLDKAKRDLVALGKVNPLATEEYDALQTRFKYLSEQRTDVVTSRDDLLGLIKDLDSTMIEVFHSAFEDTAAAFQKVFATLFPGGTGKLRLEDPDNLLETGVIVEASPAGKRVKQLSLLSGGERSLTALALLFAIFTARPSPFYIMDEVEAALDDINLTRLLNAINDLREHAQLIIITHQQRTMSIADVLYGVTMRSDGVTAVVSQKLKQGSALDEIAE